MKIDNFMNKAGKLADQIDEEDALIVVFFSKEENEFKGFDIGMDSGDALLVIEGLMERFNIIPEVVAAMNESE